MYIVLASLYEATLHSNINYDHVIFITLGPGFAIHILSRVYRFESNQSEPICQINENLFSKSEKLIYAFVKM